MVVMIMMMMMMMVLVFVSDCPHRETGDDDAPSDEQAVRDGLALNVGVGDGRVAAEKASPVGLHCLQLAGKERDGG